MPFVIAIMHSAIVTVATILAFTDAAFATVAMLVAVLVLVAKVIREVEIVVIMAKLVVDS